MTDVPPPPPVNLPVATPSSDPFSVIEAEVSAVMGRIDALVPPLPPTLEKKEVAPRTVPLAVEVPKPILPVPKPPEADPLKADYDRRVSATIFSSSAVPLTKKEMPPLPVPQPKQNIVPFPTKSEKTERPVPAPVISETRFAPSVVAEKGLPSQRQEVYKALQKEAEIAEKRSAIAKKRVELMREELDLDQLEAA